MQGLKQIIRAFTLHIVHSIATCMGHIEQNNSYKNNKTE